MVQTQKIVVLDDDTMAFEIIQGSLELECYHADCIQKIEQLEESDIASFFVDVHLRDESGFDSISLIRQKWPDALIIMMTINASETNIKRAFELGCEDFIYKPLKPQEVRARFKVRYEEKFEIFSFGDLTLYDKHGFLEGPHDQINLGPLERKLLKILAKNKGSISKDQIKESVWQSSTVSDHTLHSRIYNLRKALKVVGSSQSILSDYGKGLRWGKSE